MRDSLIVYTAIFGGYDDPKPVEPRRSLHLCFTDAPGSTRGWLSVPCERKCESPRMENRCYKIRPYLCLPMHEWSLYIDGCYQLQTSADEYAKNAIAYAPGRDLYLIEHPPHKSQPVYPHCIYREADYCVAQGLDGASIIEGQAARYRANGHPRNYGMWFGGLILRRNTLRVRRFCNAWWSEIRRGSVRDQISLAYLLRKTGIQFGSLPASWHKQWLIQHEHKSEENHKELATGFPRLHRGSVSKQLTM